MNIFHCLLAAGIILLSVTSAKAETFRDIQLFGVQPGMSYDEAKTALEGQGFKLVTQHQNGKEVEFTARQVNVIDAALGWAAKVDIWSRSEFLKDHLSMTLDTSEHDREVLGVLYQGPKAALSDKDALPGLPSCETRAYHISGQGAAREAHWFYDAAGAQIDAKALADVCDLHEQSAIPEITWYVREGKTPSHSYSLTAREAVSESDIFLQLQDDTMLYRHGRNQIMKEKAKAEYDLIRERK
ncbi:hypothetical protein [Paracoccus ravus]|uniref:hypothetical protein n=1 Tax=Paracoccus ravus TaxID=2447760 RepID=UPI00106E33E6|nr:hypothetical protein [Paracoccus ravus]